MLNIFLIAIGKLISKISKILNRGNGSTWPGHIALSGNKNFINQTLNASDTKVIIVAGTNGKTTTAALIRTGLEINNKSVIQNDSGANLLNGVASTILLNTNAAGKLAHEYAIFEVDENALPLILKQITPDYLVLLNLFRDQLDRYGEINSITKKWKDALQSISPATILILNADDPQIAYLGETNYAQKIYFGIKGSSLEKSTPQKAADSVSCPQCESPLKFDHTTFSHLGNWQCLNCGLERPHVNLDSYGDYPLAGKYNEYNTHAAVLVLRQIGLNDKAIKQSFKSFIPVFGRQEKIEFKDKNIQLFLSKNPTSFNQSFSTIKDLRATLLLIVLNDRIPDGRDISWIWDTDLTGIDQFKQILIAGDRVYEMGLRIKYENYKKFQTYENLEDAILQGVGLSEKNETFYILPNYSAMLEVRKILTGKKIL